MIFSIKNNLLSVSSGTKIQGKPISIDATSYTAKKNKKKFSSQMPDSIIIHYTAGRSAESSAKFLAGDVEASAHLVIGRDGEIFQLVPFDTKSWHAGESSYNGRRYYNNYSIGIELDNAGVLKKTGDKFISWFGKSYPNSEVIEDNHRNEDVPRFWHTYTPIQIEICEEICKLLIQQIDIKEILGHEEISKGRKQDPGPAFPLDKLRNDLLHQDRKTESSALPERGIVTASKLNIREGAGPAFDKVAKPILKGREVGILEEKDGWYKISTQVEGWVSKDFVHPK